MLQIQTIKPDCLALLKELMGIDELKSFRLAGGTALSLILGHRISIDLDLFTNQRFEVDEFSTFLKIYFEDRIKIQGNNRYGVFASIDDIKVDFLYLYEKFINEENIVQNIRLASTEDIAAMKISAAANRSSKKDYHDLYELLNVYTFAQIMEFYVKLYTNYGVASLLRTLSDFDKVNESEEEPLSLTKVSWQTVENRVTHEVRSYIHTLKQERNNTEAQKHETIKKLIDRRKNKN